MGDRGQSRAESIPGSVFEDLGSFLDVFGQKEIGISTTDLEGRFVRVDDRVCTITGYSRDQLLQLRLGDIVHQEDRNKVDEQLRQVLAGALSSCTLEKRCVRPDGHLVWIRTSIAKTPRRRSEPGRLISLIQDLTASRKSEAILEGRLEQLQGLYELTAASNRAVELTEIYEEALRALDRIIGASRASILLFDADDVLRFKSWRGISDSYRQAVEGHSPWSRSTRNPRPVFVTDVKEDATFASLLPTLLDEGIRALCFFPLVHQGQLLGKFTIYYDVPHRPSTTDIQLAGIIAYHVSSGIARKLANDERERLLQSEHASRRSAEEANRTKDAFLATLSHELRTPLTAILGWCRILREGGLAPAATTQAIETIERNARIQSGLIDDLLDVSRIVGGGLRMDLQLLDLRRLVNEAIEGAWPSALKKGLRIEAAIPPYPLRVSGDATRLQQVLGNLLSNALKHTPAGGTIKVSLDAHESEVEVRIVDTGRGISPDFLPYVFERFRQAEQGSRRSQTGLGLGLSIVRDLIELHGGSITVASPGKDRGAAFSIRLPLRAEEFESDPMETPRMNNERKPAGKPFPSLEGFNVLLVEDENDVREVLAIVLERCGAAVTAVASVREALEAYKKEIPHVIVTDIAMPLEDGFDLLSKVRALESPQQARIPAVALTGYVSNEDRRRVIDAGFQMHLPKPVDPEELATAVAKLGRSGTTGLPGTPVT